MPIRDEQGAILRWYGTCVDVDDLKHEADRLPSILDGITEPIFSLDDELRVTYCNAAAERGLARRGEELLGAKFFDAFPEGRGTVLERRHREAIDERRALSFDAPLARAADAPWYRVRVFPHAQGISVFLQPREPAPASTTGGV